MKIGIDVLGSEFTAKTNLKGDVFSMNELTSKTTTALIGDQEQILSGLSLLNESVTFRGVDF